MRYTVTSEFSAISETSGLIQNTSQIFSLEVAPSKTKDSGVLVYPLNSILFKGSPIFIRCVEDNGLVDVRVVNFANGDSTSQQPNNVVTIDGKNYTVESGSNMNSGIDDAFNKNSVPTDDNFNSDLDNIFSGNGGSSSSGDSDFDSALDNIFSP